MMEGSWETGTLTRKKTERDGHGLNVCVLPGSHVEMEPQCNGYYVLKWALGR